jgi:hypothetical protein
MCIEKKVRNDMGFFDFLFKKKKKRILPERMNVKTTISTGPDYYTREYVNLLLSRPTMQDFWDRSFDSPRYTDNYQTPEGYKLRELLLLVWWGNTKTGRKSSISIPKYFFSDYNLDAEKLTKEFKNKGLLLDDGERTKSSEEGKQIAGKYHALWEIHSVKNFPVNLDVDFPRWDKQKFELNILISELAYYNEHARFCRNIINYFQNISGYNNHIDISNEVNYYINNLNSDVAKINDLTEKIQILENK